MRVDELLSTTSTQCHLGNKYLPSCILFYDTTLCRFSHGMNFFICNCCGFCNLLIKSSLLRMWVSYDDCILRGTYIKSYLWFSHPKYVNLAIYGLCFSQNISHWILMGLTKSLASIAIFWFVILVAFLNASQLSFVFPWWYLWCHWWVGSSFTSYELKWNYMLCF